MSPKSTTHRTAWLRRCGAALALAAGAALAQTPNPSFILMGQIEQFALDSPDDPRSGASMTVRGIPVTLPSNLLITLPGLYLTAQDVFRGPRGGPVRASSGLALADSPPPRVAFEAELQGNIVGGRYIAGVARISQGAEYLGNGYIQAIDTATGELRIGARGGTAGARLRLNDPKGLYGHANGAGAKAALPLDQRFAVDPDNSPVHARTGFPVCVPRGANDPDCPGRNRPDADDVRRFTCGAVPAEPLAPALARCDPTRPVPLRVGDHVNFLGMLAPDPAGGFVIAAHGLDAELGIYTSPGKEPVYLTIEVALLGTLGEEFPTLVQEETTRVRVVGFTTDPARPVEVRLIDSGRNEAGTSLTGPAGLTPSNGAQFGRFRNTWPAKDNARAVRRDMLARVVGSPNAKLPNGLTSGLYVSPIGVYIGPEATRFGLPGYQPPVPFENFCFLNQGGGTVETAAGTQTLARLVPFPESGHAQAQLVGAGSARACDPPN